MWLSLEAGKIEKLFNSIFIDVEVVDRCLCFCFCSSSCCCFLSLLSLLLLSRRSALGRRCTNLYIKQAQYHHHDDPYYALYHFISLYNTDGTQDSSMAPVLLGVIFRGH